MKLKQYQEKNVQKIVENVLEQLGYNGSRRKIVFQAPTGSGKTVMVTEAMCRIHETIADSECPYNKVAYIWIAPNALHIQSYQSMKNAFTETHRLTPVVYDEIDLGSDGYIRPGEVFFVNWQSINKDKNVMVRGSEQVSPIYAVIARTTQCHNIPIVCIIDEEHMFVGENAKKSEKVLNQINAKVEVRISATPKTVNPDALVKIDRSDVVREEMIKQGISLNPAVRGKDAEDTMDLYLLDVALKKRNELAEAYKKQGANVNPLLLIQLPNDNSEAMTQDETALKDALLQRLEVLHNCTKENGKAAVWLSGEKTNLAGIERQDSMVDVMLFKQAVAMGWDCPRAAVLLIYRKLSSESFTIQTVGRIMRMPQQRFYTDPMLNIGFVYTDLSADVIKIEPDSSDYISMQYAYRRKDLSNVELVSYKEERSNKENNVLRSDFKKVLRDTFVDTMKLTYAPTLFDFDAEEDAKVGYESRVEENRKMAAQHVRLNVSSIQVEIPTDMNILDEEGNVVVENRTGFARTAGEVGQIFDRFCLGLLGGWSKSKCISILESSILDAMAELFEIFETDAKKVVCSKQNQPRFADWIMKALEYYRTNILEKRLKADRGLVEGVWSVPEIREYKDSTYHEKGGVDNHAMMPYYEQNGASNPEQRFTKYLEENTQYIDWWYKNGDKGSQHYAVEYLNSAGAKSLFYVDFVIRMKDGKIFLFDTKSPNSDSEAPAKHNALIDYIQKRNKEGQDMAGGVIVEATEGVWKYCPLPIENTTDLTNWNAWFPDQK